MPVRGRSCRESKGPRTPTAAARSGRWQRYRAIFSIRCSAKCSFRGHPAQSAQYVCRSTYYEGRHTDLQLIFSSMAKATDSKGKTLAAAAKLLRQQGYHGTALHDILAAGGSPRGSLYFHFPGGKEQIGEAALTLAGEAVRQGIARLAEASDSAEIFLVRIV